AAARDAHPAPPFTLAADTRSVSVLGKKEGRTLRAKSEREVRNYACPLLGKPVVVSYLFEQAGIGHGAPRGVHCAGARECGVERVSQGGGSEFDWAVCPLRPDLVREGFLPG
ncbi:MAG: hypothetical protein KAS89_08215, partial [Candidatus Eisenbacteria sp.]|nr:hypothetical protein [Candidatus Eisenbacteria bacterium]